MVLWGSDSCGFSANAAKTPFIPQQTVSESLLNTPEPLIESNYEGAELAADILGVGVVSTGHEVVKKNAPNKTQNAFTSKDVTKYAVINSEGRFHIAAHNDLQQALFTCATDHLTFQINDRVSNEAVTKDFDSGVIKAMDLSFPEAVQKKKDYQLEFEKHAEREKRSYKYLGQKSFAAPSFRQTRQINHKPRRVTFKVGGKYGSVGSASISFKNKLREAYKTPRKPRNFNWLIKPQKDIWEFRVNFQYPKSVEDRNLLNHYFEFSRHLAPVTINDQVFPMMEGNWATMYSRLEDMKKIIISKIPTRKPPSNSIPNPTFNILEKLPSNKDSEMTNEHGNCDLIDFIENGNTSQNIVTNAIEFLTNVTQNNLETTENFPSSNQTKSPVPTQIDNYQTQPKKTSAGKSAAWQKMMITRTDTPEWESDNETNSALDEQDQEVSQKHQKRTKQDTKQTPRKRIKKHAWSTFLSIPSYSNSKAFSSKSLVTVDNYFKISPTGLKKALELVNGKKKSYDQLEVGKTIFRIHPFFNTEIYNNWAPDVSNKEMDNIINQAKDYIRESGINFIRNLLHEIKFEETFDITENIKIYDDPQFFRYNVKKHVWGSKMKERVQSEFNQIKLYTECKLPRIVELPFTQRKSIEFWLGVQNKEWISCSIIHK